MTDKIDLDKDLDLTESNKSSSVPSTGADDCETKTISNETRKDENSAAVSLELLGAQSIFSTEAYDFDGKHKQVRYRALEELKKLLTSSDETLSAALAQTSISLHNLVYDLIQALKIWHGPQVDLPLLAVLDKLATNTITAPLIAKHKNALQIQIDRCAKINGPSWAQFAQRVANINRVAVEVVRLKMSDVVAETMASGKQVSLRMYIGAADSDGFESYCKTLADALQNGDGVQEVTEAVKSLGVCGLLLPVTDSNVPHGGEGRYFLALLGLIQGLASAHVAAAVTALQYVAPKGCDGCVWLGLICMAARWPETTSSVELLIKTLIGERTQDAIGDLYAYSEVHEMASLVRSHYIRKDQSFPFMGNCLDFKAPIGLIGELDRGRSHACVLGSLLVSKHLRSLMAADESGTVVLVKLFLGSRCTSRSFDDWFEKKKKSRSFDDWFEKKKKSGSGSSGLTGRARWVKKVVPESESKAYLSSDSEEMEDSDSDSDPLSSESSISSESEDDETSSGLTGRARWVKKVVSKEEMEE